MLNIAKNITICAGVIVIAGASAYFIAKPMLVEKCEPVLQENIKKYINGTITWDKFDLDAAGNLKFHNVQIKDNENQDVLKSPDLNVGWSFSSAYKAFVKGEGLTALIDNITIEKPEITVREKNDKSWNIQNLIITDKEKKKSNFDMNIKVIDGNVSIKQQNKQTQNLKNINSVIKLKNDFELKGKLSAIYENSNVDLAWNYLNFNDIELTFGSGKLPLVKILDTLRENGIKIPDLPVTDGIATIKAGQITKKNNEWSYSIKGNIEKVFAKYKEFTISETSANVDITNGNAFFENINGKINNQSVFGYFKINWNGKESEIQSKFSTNGAELYSFAPSLGMHGKLQGDIQIGGSLNNIFATGHVNINNLNNETFNIKEVKTDFNFNDDIVNLTSLNLKTKDGKAHGQASYNLRTKEFGTDIDLNSIKLQDVILSSPIEGTISGNIKAEGTYSEGINLYSAKITGTANNFKYEDVLGNKAEVFATFSDNEWNIKTYGSGISAKGINFENIEANVTKKGNNIILHSVKGFNDGGTIAVEGNIQDNKNNLNMSLYNWNINSFSGFIGHKITGRTTADIQIQGELANPYISGNAEIYNGSFDDITFKHSSGKFHTDENAFNIDCLNIQKDEDLHVVTGKIYRDNDNTLDLFVKSSGMRIENVLPILNLSYPLTGNADNELHIKGTFRNPDIEGYLHAWDGSVKGQLFKNIYGNYRYNNGTLYIQNGQVNAYGGAATVEGTASEKLLNLNVNAVDIDLESILPERGISGKIGVKGHLGGTATDPDFDGTVLSQSVNLGNSNLGLISAQIKYKNNVFLVQDGNFYQGNAKFKVKGRYNIQTSMINGSLSYNNWNLSDIVKIFKLPVQNIDGQVDGYIGLSGSMYDTNVDFKADVNGGHLGSTEIGKGNIDISYLNKELNIRNLNIPVGNGVLAAKGSMSSDGVFDMQFAARNMDTEWIPEVFGVDSKIGGKLTAALVLEGTRKNPEMNISVGIENPVYNDYKFDEISLMGVIKNNIIDVQNALLIKDKYKASMKGVAPLSLITRKPSSNEIPIDLKFNLDNADMNALALFFRPVQKAEGPVKGQLKVTGAWNDPKVLGDISVSNGSMTLITMNEPLKSVNLNAKFKGNSMDLEGSASVGKGNVSLKGSADWGRNNDFSYNGEFHLHAPEIKSQFYNGAIDTDFKFEPYDGMPGMKGNVNIHNASLDIPLLQSDGELPNIITDIGINVGENVRLYNSALYNMTISGDIHMDGSLSNPFMTGRINVDKGTIKVNTTEFKVEKGQALWGGNPNSFMPTVHVASNANVGNYKIGAQIDGIPGNLETKLHSEPYLNDSQILMLLTLHQNPHASAEDTNQNAFFNAGLAMLFNGGVKDFLTDKIGLDMISVTSGLNDYNDSTGIDKNNFYYIKIGKYIFNDFMLTATGGLNNEERSIGFRYDVNSHLGISAWYNNNHDSFVGTDWKFKF